jgi:glycine/D-amino acid oxidase-like deaminating enzyme
MAQKSRWSADEITPFEVARVLNPPPSPVALANIEMQLRQWLPELSDVPIEQAWAGMIDTTPDVVPVMDAIPGYTALFVATGFSGHGFGIGPAAGKTMADMVMGKPVSHDLHRFRFSRFSDGSKMVPGPGI